MQKQKTAAPNKFKPLQVVRVCNAFGANPAVVHEGDIVAIVGREDYEGTECYRVTKPGMSKPHLFAACDLESVLIAESEAAQ